MYRVRRTKNNKIELGSTCLVSEQCEQGEQGEKHGKGFFSCKEYLVRLVSSVSKVNRVRSLQN